MHTGPKGPISLRCERSVWKMVDVLFFKVTTLTVVWVIFGFISLNTFQSMDVTPAPTLCPDSH